MKKAGIYISRRDALLGSAALAFAAAAPAAAQGQALTAVIDVSRTFPPIKPEIYGGFQEHIGNLINHSLWSEALDDRKFYHAVTSEPDPEPESGFGGMRALRKWSPIGPESSVVMDASAPYVGKHSPVVTLAGSDLRGIAQNGLSLASGKSYVGRIVIASDRGVKVSATLIWGEGPDNRQTVKLKSAKDWSTVHFEFTPAAETTQGRIEIAASGSGTFRVGAVSLMPEDNVKGFRADTLALMREMDCHTLRIPGGNFISAYDWKDTIGDPDRRPPILDPVWNAVQPNDVGVDELLQFCELIGAEPSWCVSTGFGEPRSGAECVEYVNGSADTEWGAKRAANGRKEPYGVKYWNIGNEMYGNWQRGHMSRDHYIVKHNLFADAMRAVDPSIYIIAPGGFADEMTTGQGIFIAGQPRVEIGSERDWAYGMIEGSWGKFDALATHAYPPEGKRFDLKTGELFDVEQSLVEWASQPANRIATMTDCWEAYKKAFPKLANSDVKVYFDEWAYHFQPDLKGCLAIARAFHEFFRHTDFIDMAGYTMATGWLTHDRLRSVINAYGRIFQLYNRHFGSIPVAVAGNSPTPPPKYPVGGDQPKVNTGSPTHPLDVSAALAADKQALIVAVVNATEEARSLGLTLQEFPTKPTGRSWKFTGASLDAVIPLNGPPQIEIIEGTFDALAPALSVAPISIEFYEYAKA